MKKRIIVIALVLMVIVGSPAMAKERNLDVKIATDKRNVHFSTTQALLISDRYYISLREVTERLGLSVGWDGDERKLTIQQLNGMKLMARFDDSVWYINDLPYYCLDKSFIIIENRTYAPIRVLLEPICQVQFIRAEQTDTIHAKENEIYNRVKILAADSEIIINYKLHSLTTKLIQQNEEVFVPLRDFIELIDGRLEYHETSEYGSPEIKILPANMNRVIALYPEKNQVILLNNDTKEEEFMKLTQQLLQKNGSYFMGVTDLILILQAEKDSYLDSDVNTYFNFEF
ncbi:MAG: stalk domain-containing protein [Caldisericia bacterium]|nr:stalk domain-containing protein [Caldisericia bacterium]